MVVSEVVPPFHNYRDIHQLAALTKACGSIGGGALVVRFVVSQLMEVF